MAKLNQRSLFQTWNELFALLGGGFLGIYILGTYTHRANAIGAFTGAIASIGVTLWLKYFTAVHWYFYTPGAVIACVVIGYVVSLLTPPPKHSLAGLTIFDMKSTPVSESANSKQP
jgi:Na+/proline symporter